MTEKIGEKKTPERSKSNRHRRSPAAAAGTSRELPGRFLDAFFSEKPFGFSDGFVRFFSFGFFK